MEATLVIINLVSGLSEQDILNTVKLNALSRDDVEELISIHTIKK